jgi:hypothetical protein
VLRGLLCLLAACAFTPPTPQAFVQRGPAFGQPVTPLAALPVECGATTLGCLPGYKLAVASATRIAIEFGGYTLVDSELINAEMQRRTSRRQETVREEPTTPGPGVTAEETTTTEVTGRTWFDLPPHAQRDLLAAMGVRGVLRATIAMSIPQGMAGLRMVSVGISVSRLSDGQLVWQSRCGVMTGDFHSEPQAIELATRCALESGTLW